MSTETIDYAAVLADLEAKREALDAAIVAIRLMPGLGPFPASIAPGAGLGAAGPSAAAMEAADIPQGAFLGLSISDAARKYLDAVKKKQSTKQIADALIRGGVHSTSGNFTTIVYSVLGRQSDIVRVGGDWGLAIWYPVMSRSAEKPKPAARGARTRGRKKMRRREARAAKGNPAQAGDARPKAPHPVASAGPLPSMRARILATINGDPQRTWSARTVAAALGDADLRKVQNALARLVFDESVLKANSGEYRSRKVQMNGTKGHAANAEGHAPEAH